MTPNVLSLHRCKICGARWLLWPDLIHGGGWNLLDRYQRPGACCDNVAMGEQIEHLRDIPLQAQQDAARIRELEAKLVEHQKDVQYHADCRPNRRQAEAWRDDAKATNDKWADEVAKNRELAARIRDLEAQNDKHKQELPSRVGPLDAGAAPQGSTASSHEVKSPLPRYGIRWQGPHSPISVPMEDGYWTPWHLADELVSIAPTGALCLMNIRQWVDEGVLIHRRQGGDVVPPGLASQIAAQVWLHVCSVLRRETPEPCKCGCSRDAHVYYLEGRVFTGCNICRCEGYEPAPAAAAIDPVDGASTS